MKHFAILLFSLVVTAATAQADALLPDGVLADIKSADVVILGEVHDNPQHHKIQAEALKAMAPSAVVWEMVTEEGAQRLADKAVSDPEELARILEWLESGWPPLSMYYPVFRPQTRPFMCDGPAFSRACCDGAWRSNGIGRGCSALWPYGSVAKGRAGGT